MKLIKLLLKKAHRFKLEIISVLFLKLLLLIGLWFFCFSKAPSEHLLQKNWQATFST